MTQQAKADNGKPRITLVPPRAITGIAEIRAYGDSKYGDTNNWREVSNERFLNASLRHILHMVEYGMDSVDEESGLYSVDHALCSLAFISQRIKEGKK